MRSTQVNHDFFSDKPLVIARDDGEVSISIEPELTGGVDSLTVCINRGRYEELIRGQHLYVNHRGKVTKEPPAHPQADIEFVRFDSYFGEVIFNIGCKGRYAIEGRRRR